MPTFNPTTAFAAYGPLTTPERWSIRDGEVLVTTNAVTTDDQGQVLKAGQSLDFPAGVTVYARTPKYAVVSRETGLAAGMIINDPGASWSYAAAASGILNTTVAVTIKAAAGAGLSNYIRAFTLNAEALAAASEFVIRNGAAGTVLWRQKIGTAGLLSGFSVEFSTPLKSSQNTLLEIATLTASVTGAVYFNAQGYVAP